MHPFTFSLPYYFLQVESFSRNHINVSKEIEKVIGKRFFFFFENSGFGFLFTLLSLFLFSVVLFGGRYE